MPRLVVVVLVSVLLLTTSACSGDDASDVGVTSATTVVGPVPGSSGSPPATSATTATSSVPPPAGTAPFVTFPPASTDGVSPEGSGCSPSSANELPDGIWFGVLTSVDPSAGTVGLDLACLFFGQAANAAAAADGFTEIPVPNDYWIRNASTNVYTLPVVPDVAVVTLVEDRPAEFAPPETGLDAVARVETSPLLRPDWWIEVRDGWVVAMQQQYFP